jgi:hypothetical protein
MRRVVGSVMSIEKGLPYHKSKSSPDCAQDEIDKQAIGVRARGKNTTQRFALLPCHQLDGGMPEPKIHDAA